MDQQAILKILDEVGAIITADHLVYTSGKHGSAYINKNALFVYPEKTSQLCWAIARLFKEDKVDVVVVVVGVVVVVVVVVGPATGGIILATLTSMHLSALNAYAEKDEKEGFIIKRDMDNLLPGKNVLVVEDILNTGGSAKKVVEAVRKHDGNVIGVGVLCNRGGVTAQDLANVPRLEALVNVTLDAYDEAACPLCKAGVPINQEIGKGREYLAHKECA